MLAADPIAQEALLELDGGVRRIDDALLEGLAEWMRAQSRDGSIEGIVAGLGRELVIAPLPAGVPGLHTAGRVFATRLRDRASQRVVIAHEASHVVARGSGFNDAHGDVWRLTLAVMIPLSRVRDARTTDPVTLAVAAQCPWWTAWARLRMPHVLEAVRAA